ncbi:hypothetical protein [Segatella copri]|jgi:hypothetical protein|uniref:hypothetical protein n=1 Tax=Segatella copri TaxID=165179 RepID=UPI00294B0ACF|nr:hypothetical protein [Segatella copri]
MEKTIYIPGDLVMTNGIPIGTKKGIVYQVTESNADKYAKVKDGNAFTELKGSVTLSNLKGKTIKDDGFLFCDSGAWVKDIVPIPLTPSILEKNGWKRDDYDWYRLPVKRAYLYITKDTEVKDEFLVCAGLEKHNLASVSFVHELQHLLYGLKINSEMEI